MAESTLAAATAAPVPDRTAIERAERFTRERFVSDGEDVAVALAPGSARRHALEAALAELDAGATVPSTRWRRRYALMLGLERLLSEDEPRLADGTVLSPHQVDALSGTLTALLAEAQRNGGAPPPSAAPVLAVDEEEPADEEPSDDGDVDGELEDDDEDESSAEAEADAEVEAYEDEDDVDEALEDEGAPDDPNAHKRFWFEHATGAGKTVAAMGFVEASRTGGVLILTHRRNLVDQFLGELHQRGYGKRESPPLLDGAGTGRVDGPVDVEFDQEMLAELLDQLPFNLAIADLYKTRFNGVPGVVYAAGVRHAMNVAQAFRELGLKAQGVSGETPKRELAEILAAYERGEVDVLVNAQLLAEGWNSPRATVCMHLAPTASRRIYQQRVGRVTRRQQGKEAGIVVDFVHPATTHDDPVVTLHSLLDRDVYRGGAIVVGPIRRGRGRRLRVERRGVAVPPHPPPPPPP